MSIVKVVMTGLVRMVRSFVRSRHVSIFAPAGAGSIGDQAMLDTLCRLFIEKGVSTSVIYLPECQAITIRPEHKNVFMSRKRNWSLSLVTALLRSDFFLVLGADVIDGHYSWQNSFDWIGILDRARRAGVPGGIINFSFSEEFDEGVISALREALDITFTVRDPFSFDRFTRHTGQPAALTADLAFLLEPELSSPGASEAYDWLSARKEAGDVILLVNLSGHTLARMTGDGVAAMGQALQRWLETSTKRSILLVPHDFRSAPIGDIEPLQKLNDLLAERYRTRVRMLHPPFEAWDVKALCGRADIAISGRMHLAIACLGRGVPVVSVVYVGKFEGLMQHLGLSEENLLLQPHEATHAERIAAALEHMTTDRVRLSHAIKARLAAVRQLSRLNVDWIWAGETDEMARGRFRSSAP